jgi:hypothetical protein
VRHTAKDREIKMRQKREKTIRKTIRKTMLTGFMAILLAIAIPVFSMEVEVNLSFGSYAKGDEYFKEFYAGKTNMPCLGVSLFLSKYIAVYVDAGMISASGKSSYEGKALEYNEKHLSIGLQYRFPIFSFSQDKTLLLYLKGGSLFLRYAETFEEKIAETIPGYCIGAGWTFRFKRAGIGLEVVKNFANEEIEIQGLNIVEEIDFSGVRFSLKGSYSF